MCASFIGAALKAESIFVTGSLRKFKAFKFEGKSNYWRPVAGFPGGAFWSIRSQIRAGDKVVDKVAAVSLRKATVGLATSTFRRRIQRPLGCSSSPGESATNKLASSSSRCALAEDWHESMLINWDNADGRASSSNYITSPIEPLFFSAPLNPLALNSELLDGAPQAAGRRKPGDRPRAL